MAHYTAKELAEQLQKEGDEEITLRMVRYYTQIGMLSPLEPLGGKFTYTDKHLNELRAVRTMKKTGEKLDDIKEKLNGLDVNALAKVGEQSQYYSSERLITTEAIQVHPEITLTFGQQISDEMKESIVLSVQNELKKFENE